MTSDRETIQIGDHEIPVEYADSALEQARGHMFRTSTPDYGLVFPFDGTGLRSLHMLFVPFSLDAVYVTNGVVEKVSTLRPMLSLSWGKAETIIELPAGEYDISPGDKVRQP